MNLGSRGQIVRVESLLHVGHGVAGVTRCPFGGCEPDLAFFFGLVYCGVLLLEREFVRRLSKRFSGLFPQLGLVLLGNDAFSLHPLFCSFTRSSCHLSPRNKSKPVSPWINVSSLRLHFWCSFSL